MIPNPPNPRLRRRRVTVASGAVALSSLVALTWSAPGNASPAPAPPTIAVGSNPISIAYDAGSHTAYVANDGSVSVLDTATNTETGEFKTGFHGQNGIALVEGNRRLLVANVLSRSLRVVDPAQQRIVGKIRIGRGAQKIAVARSGAHQRAYVTQIFTNRVSIVNPARGRVVKRIHMGQHQVQVIATLPDQSQVWVGSLNMGKIWVINTRNNKISRTISVPFTSAIAGIAFGPQGQRAWVSGLNGVAVINTHTGKTLHTVSYKRLFPGALKTFHMMVGDLTLSPNGRYAMVLNRTQPLQPSRGSVTVLNTKTLSVSERMRLGVQPSQIIVAGRTAYVANFNDDTVSFFPAPR